MPKLLNDTKRETVNHTLMQIIPFTLSKKLLLTSTRFPPWCVGIEHSQRSQRDVYHLICHGRVTAPLVVEGGNIVIIVVIGLNTIVSHCRMTLKVALHVFLLVSDRGARVREGLSKKNSC